MTAEPGVLPVSVVIPVLDEVTTLPRLFASLRQQSVRPGEILVVDGGSRDGTQALVRAAAGDPDSPAPIRLIELQGSRPGRSRNAGTEQARFDRIACTDAGVDLDPDWLRTLVEPLDDHGVSVGTFVPRGETRFERLVGLLLVRPPDRVKLLYAGGVSIAFTREAWSAVHGYPEDVYPCEDAKFLRDLRGADIPIARAAGAVSHWRPRANLRQLWQQYRSYAWGDAMIRLGGRRHLLRWCFYLVCLALLTGIAGWPGAAIGGALLGAYLLRPTVRAWRREPALQTLLLAPAILACKDLAQMTGYLEGIWNRWRGGAADFGRRRQGAGPVRKTA